MGYLEKEEVFCRWLRSNLKENRGEKQIAHTSRKGAMSTTSIV